VLAFPQADIECDIYMEIPIGFKVKGDHTKYALRLKRNLYGQRQAGRVWNMFLHDGLLARGFQQSTVDMYVYYQGEVALLIYTDDGIFIGPDQMKIQECYDLLAQAVVTADGRTSRAFNITDERTLSDYLGVQVTPLPNGTFKLSQPHLINSILIDLGLNDPRTKEPKAKFTPAPSHVKLGRDLEGAPYEEPWSYRAVIGKMNFPEKSTRAEHMSLEQLSLPANHLRACEIGERFTLLDQQAHPKQSKKTA
jgi:Reverse transcriptase (RNA-dependent DNA polymerase)